MKKHKFQRTGSRYRQLQRVFHGPTPSKLDAQIARLCVLFEDLRIEVHGLSADPLGEMDVTGNQRLYFLRRSIATLMEAAKAVTQLDGNPEFDAIRARFEGINAQRWRRAVRFFNRYGKNFITPIRHSIGGHFLLEAAKHAITELGEDTSGAIEIVVDGYGKGGFRLHFCRHLAGAALTHKVPGSAQYAIKFRRLFRTAHVGYHHVVRAVEALGYHDLWDRFS